MGGKGQLFKIFILLPLEDSSLSYLKAMVYSPDTEVCSTAVKLNQKCETESR